MGHRSLLPLIVTTLLVACGRELFDFPGPDADAADASASSSSFPSESDGGDIDGGEGPAFRNNEGGSTDDCTREDCGAQLVIAAKVDGITDLILKGNELRWYHIKYVPPSSTTINGATWKPDWPAQSVSCKCDSSTTTIRPALPRREQTVKVTLEAGRSPISVEQPSKDNDYQLTVHFNDDESGPDSYQLRIDYTP